ncbi:50S ribosomal protein L25/general stress protein Ctc [Pseudonocardia sp. KRD-184]|uniref:Large ribosomal subunit protein bL25 n=1 Tax=Pseudonocardia oceani TaxID=2792013 RepID=A0ABS6UBI5_9PSEU|nr:50S ribosomal protein L25/general stress protein Ctc [Pseudonocardia oceani]MBW0091120.1 50S ribosomal protein L25/general stress protein Ctc [Pseudonocardia oceani]MBW0098226.1 50S ribosomal protein L25/general stress protein Ctc [Pseudonocardia oceani]MBW0110789.1 50S ribosomal protein L25/general stress protein Ctc [Pseudonocardia oceani]MBW0124832.1 50S ribosomal protein L25/general stress protein Ctc [Pseudonocardia oceani]MBW0129605.1 50S ribosomal protein L25/general stress protein C
MAEARIDAETRTEFGKGAARRTRRAGKIPAVLYGHGTDPQHLSLPELEFKRVVREQGRNAVLTLNIGGTPQLALTKTVVQHPIRPYIEHVDLLVIRRGEKVEVEVQVIISGSAAPGTLVTQELNTLLVEADVSSIPETIEVSVDGLPIGTQILAGSLTMPANTELKTDPEGLVVNVNAAPTESDMEAEVDVEGAGVVEDAPETEADEDSSAEAGSEESSDDEKSES